MDDFVITHTESPFASYDTRGQKKNFIKRRTACFIITLRGRIRFLHEKAEVVAEEGRPVFIPRGCTYVNECLENAESYVFNFQTLLDYDSPIQLASIPQTLATEYYEQIKARSDLSSVSAKLSIFEAVYSLAALLFRDITGKKLHPAVERAMDYMRMNFCKDGLTVNEIASYCCISEVYLRKLFKRETGCTPFYALTEIRMKKAALLVEEKRALKEISEAVGYVDVFQFSRAYKRFFGYSPIRGK